MPTDTTEQIVREAPEVEAYKMGLYGSALDYIRNLQAQGIQLPTQAVAGLSAEQMGAGQMLRSGLGAYEPYIMGGLGAVRGGQAAISESALPMMQQAYGAYGRGMDTLSDAERLSGATRGLPYQYQQQAMRGITDAMGGARRGTAGGISALRGLQDYSRILGQQGQAGMEGLSRASQATGMAGRGAIQGLAGRSIGAAMEGQRGLQDMAGRSYGVGEYGRAGMEGMAGRSLGAAERGIQALGGTGERYDPRSAKEFYDPYLKDVIEAEQAEIDRLGLKQSRRAQAGATSAGAFGGSRAAIQQSEIGRNVLEQQARTGAGLRSQGYQQAQQAAMGAFEQSQRRRQQAAQMMGQMGLAGAGQAGQQLGQAAQFGLAGAGQAGQQLGQAAQLGLAGYGQEAQQAAQAAQLGLAGLGQAGQQRGQGIQFGMAGAAQSGQQAAQASQLAQALGQMGLGAAGQRGQLGLQYGQLGQADVQQLMQMAGQRAQMGQGIGALAGQTGQLVGRLAAMGGQQAQLGQMMQQSNLADVSALMNLGNMTQQQAQNVLNAQYQAQMNAYQQPFREYGFLADMTKALPSSQSAMFQSSSPSPSWFQQGAGLATGVAGLMGGFRGGGF